MSSDAETWKCQERYCLSWLMCIKGFVYRLFHDCQYDIDRDVSAAYYRSSSGDCVDLLSRIICTTVVDNNALDWNPPTKRGLWFTNPNDPRYINIKVQNFIWRENGPLQRVSKLAEKSRKLHRLKPQPVFWEVSPTKWRETFDFSSGISDFSCKSDSKYP